MRAWSIPVGKLFGTEIRVHLSFLLLFALVLTQTSKAGVEVGRGVALFFIIFAAVALHEAARALFAPGKRDRLQRLVLLPTGGVVLGETSEPTSGTQTPFSSEVRAALAGPIASLVFAGFAAALVTTLAQVKIFASPYIHSAHLGRSVVWVNLSLG